jgi:plastocyanin
MRSTLAILALLLAAVAARAGEVRGRVVGAEGEGLADAVVFASDLPLRAHPPAAVMDQVHKQFVPHLLVVPVGTEVRFPNHDQIHHHVYSFSRAKSFELPLYKGEAATPVTFDTPGAVKIGCNIHDWMSAVILVVPSAYATRTDADGGFVLDLPPGEHRVVAWHEHAETPLDETARRVAIGTAPAEATFRVVVRPPIERPPILGARGIP